MRINGIGVVSARGRGTACLEEALAQGWTPPTFLETPFSGCEGFPVYAVPNEALSDKTFSRKIRRADRLSKMAVVAAADAVAESRMDISDTSRIGIVFATAFGPHATTFKFLDDIIDYGDGSVSPTSFSHSVHNAAASYIASVLDIRGPVMTVTHFHFAFQEAVRLAALWLGEGRCDHVLVGAADECGTAMEFIANRRLNIAPDGKIHPFRLEQAPPSVPGEGSAFFLVSAEAGDNTYCAVATEESGDADLQVIGADGMSADESAYLQAIDREIPVTAYAPLVGSLMTGSSFDCAAAALMVRNGIVYPPPAVENPHGLCLPAESNPAPNSIKCIKCDCGGRSSILELSK